jgi:hypothetical protein
LDREDHPHKKQDNGSNNKELAAQRDIVRGREDIGMRKARCDEKPFHHDKQEIGLFGRDRQHDKDIEQNWYFELILETIADLLDAAWPWGLAQSDVLPFDFTALEKDGAFLRHPENEETRQSNLNKKGQKDRLKSHAAWS